MAVCEGRGRARAGRRGQAKHGDGCPVARLAGGRHRTAVDVHQLAHNGQADAAAPGLLRARVIAAIEAVEDVGQVLRGDPRPAVIYLDHRAVALARRAQPDLTPGVTELEGVVEQVD